MTDGNGNKIGIFDFLRFGTPILVTVTIFLSGILLTKINVMEERIFKHLTNEELHAPRSMYVSNAEFALQTKFTEQYFVSVQKSVEDIRCDLKYITEKKLK